MAYEAENVSPTSQVEESDPDVLLSPPPDARPEPGLHGKPVRCE
jgi:phosphatidylserine synthase 2